MGSKDGSEKKKISSKKMETASKKTPPLHQPDDIIDEDLLEMSHDQFLEEEWRKRRDKKRKHLNRNKKDFD